MNPNKCCIEIKPQKTKFSKLSKLNPNKCCIEILHKKLFCVLCNFCWTQTNVVLKYKIKIDYTHLGLLNPNKCCIEIKKSLHRNGNNTELNPNKCCIEIVLSETDCEGECPLNPNKCCIEINPDGDNNDTNPGWTQTNIVLKYSWEYWWCNRGYQLNPNKCCIEITPNCYIED